MVHDGDDVRKTFAGAGARGEDVVAILLRLADGILLMLVEQQVIATANGGSFFPAEHLGAGGFQQAFGHQSGHGLAGLERGIQLDERVGPERAGLETAVHEILQARLGDGDEAGDVAAVILNDLVPKVKYVHKQIRSASNHS